MVITINCVPWYTLIVDNLIQSIGSVNNPITFPRYNQSQMARGTSERRVGQVEHSQKPTIKILPHGQQKVNTTFLEKMKFSVKLFFKGNRFWTRGLVGAAGILFFIGGCGNVDFLTI
jgi:hypothetical protein